jgi:predicted porin
VTWISYYAPRIAGFELGISYAPVTGSSGTDINRNNFGGPNTVLLPPPGAPVTQSSMNYNFKDVWEAGVNYADTLGGISAKANVDVMGGNTKDSFQNPSGTANPTAAALPAGGSVATHNPLFGVQTGLQAGYGGLTAGGGLLYFGNSGLAKPAVYNHADQWAWNAGLQYVIGAYVLGASYQHAEDPGTPFGSGAKKLDQYIVGARYIVAKGLNLNVQYDRINLTNTKSSGANYVTGDVVVLRTNVTF